MRLLIAGAYGQLGTELVRLGSAHESLISFVTDRPDHDWCYAIDAHKMSSELGWKPSETFETGVRQRFKLFLNISSFSQL